MILTSTVGCGHPATQEECEQIVGKMAELKIKADRPARPETVEAEVAALKAKFAERTLQQCVGKRINARAKRCIESAQTAEAIRDCF